MESTTATHERLATATRVGRLFVKRLQGRSTLIIVLLVALIIGVALATIRNGVSLSAITGSESTDDAYVRADQIAILSHIAGYVTTIPVADNQTVRQGQRGQVGLLPVLEDQQILNRYSMRHKMHRWSVP